MIKFAKDPIELDRLASIIRDFTPIVPRLSVEQLMSKESEVELYDFLEC